MTLSVANASMSQPSRFAMERIVHVYGGLVSLLLGHGCRPLAGDMRITLVSN